MAVKKIRNYSFKSSKKLPEDKMTEINGIKIPAMPGSCYHAIICSLAVSKNSFVPWPKIVERTRRYMIQYGGYEAWEKFQNKNKVKPCSQRIKENVHTLTRKGRNCYGFRLHERGMGIYFFKDGAMLLTGGEFIKKRGGYDVVFPDGRSLQKRYRGTTMTSKEYKRFVDEGFITPSGEIIDNDAIKKFRSQNGNIAATSVRYVKSLEKVKVLIMLDENYNQNTAIRLSKMGLVVTSLKDNELIGMINRDKVDDLMQDDDVLGVEILNAVMT